ncbi:MAG: carboxypeptidase-like regulatory domain-containing protein [Actinomycetota bacterium]
MHRGRGRQWSRQRWVAAVGMPAASLASLLALAACGAGGDARQLTLSPGASTIAGELPSMATLGEPPAGADAAPPGATMDAPVRAVDPAPRASAAVAPPATPAATTTAAAAPQLGVVHGVVTRGGRPVAGARVTLVAADGTERVTTTDPTGSYRFGAVPPGAYEAVGYAESPAECGEGGCISASWAEKVDLSLAAGETRRLDIDGD